MKKNSIPQTLLSLIILTSAAACDVFPRIRQSINGMDSLEALGPYSKVSVSAYTVQAQNNRIGLTLSFQLDSNSYTLSPAALARHVQADSASVEGVHVFMNDKPFSNTRVVNNSTIAVQIEITHLASKTNNIRIVLNAPDFLQLNHQPVIAAPLVVTCARPQTAGRR